MTLWEHLISLARRMPREPRQATAELIEIDLPREVTVVAYLVVMAISVIVTEPLLAAASTVFPGEPLPPLVRAVGSTLGGLAVVWGIWKFGALIKGRGSFDQVFQTFVVLEGIFVLGILGLLVLVVLLPALAGLVGLAFIAYWLWMLAQAMAEVHGFPSAWKAFGIIVLSWVIVNYASIILLNLFSGLLGGPSNV